MGIITTMYGNLKQSFKSLNISYLALPFSLEQLVNILQPYDIYIVGGYVRKLLLRQDVTKCDIDLTSRLTPEELVKLLPSTYKVIETGLKHGTLTIICPNGDKYEHTTFRTDHDCDGRHAMVRYAFTIDEDIKRRDLTINALAINVRERYVYGSRQSFSDIKNRIIRFNGNPFKRIDEDYLRLVRAVRFLSEDSTFDLDWISELAIRWKAKHIRKYVSSERIRDEFEKCLCFINHFVATLHELDVFKYLILDESHYVAECPFYNNTNVDWMWASLKPPHMDMLDFQELFKLSNDTIRTVSELLEIIPQMLKEKDAVSLYRLNAKLHNISFLQGLEYYGLPKERYERISFIISKEQIVQPQDLLAAGMLPGRWIPKLIDEAFRIQLRYPLFDKKEILSKMFREQRV